MNDSCNLLEIFMASWKVSLPNLWYMGVKPSTSLWGVKEIPKFSVQEDIGWHVIYNFLRNSELGTTSGIEGLLQWIPKSPYTIILLKYPPVYKYIRLEKGGKMEYQWVGSIRLLTKKEGFDGSPISSMLSVWELKNPVGKSSGIGSPSPVVAIMSFKMGRICLIVAAKLRERERER